MGQKIHPKSMRIGITEPWSSRWFFAGRPDKISQGKNILSGKKYPFAKFLEEDEAIRNIIAKKLNQAGIASVDIERTASTLRVLIRAARPGFIIGRGGKGIEELTVALEKSLKKIRDARDAKGGSRLSVNIEELKRSEVAAVYVAQQIAWDLERRMPTRRTMKKYLEQLVQSRDVKGARILLSGRLDGAEIARRERLSHGALPLQTLRAHIDFGRGTAFTSYGTVGIKVWIYKGETFSSTKNESKTNERMDANSHIRK